MNTTIHFPANVNQIHSVINLDSITCCPDNHILEILETGAKIPLNNIVQPFTEQRIVLIWRNTAMITRNAHKCDCGEMLTEFGNKFGNQLGYAFDLFNHILFVRNSDRLVDISTNSIAVRPDNAVLASMRFCNSNDSV